jgi:hypothetical protein
VAARRRLRHGNDFRVIQFTPPGSGCSVIFGKNVTAAAPGSSQGLYLIVSDIAAARSELLGRGVKVSEVFHGAGDVYAGPEEPYLFGRIRVKGPDPAYGSYRSSAVQRSSTQGLGGGSTPTTTTTMTFASFNSPHLAPPARSSSARTSRRRLPALPKVFI